jgi:catechol 2,3-dioxygenase-like lactoylglutathione lyase family enzyme
MAAPTIALSHFGIHVTDGARMVDFYTRVLGLLVTDRGALPHGPWHTPQPFAEPFDIEASVDTILAETEARCRSREGFVSRAAWRQTQVERMGV